MNNPPTPYVAAGLVAVMVIAGALACGVGSSGRTRFPQPGGPAVHDERLELTLFASEPDIVTPIGIAVDASDRVFVLESHTHLQASDYPGPKSDRVKILVDRNRDGTPDDVRIFAEGIEDGMNLAFSPSGELHVVTARGVWALHDRDGDGVSEARTRILDLVKPAKVYDHAALMGIAFSHDGWMYVSRGNTGSSAWRLEGTDGTFLSGYGDGGNIIRSRPDGTRLEEVATGFWNPFDLKFVVKGRLLASDNDPDSRGPNRLLHIVAGGDYGYKSLYGGSGIHPYLAWNGELPGTLPYAAALGEAPAGMFVAAGSGLPADYRDDVLVTIWEERTIARVRLSPRGSSIGGEAVPLIQGDERFRPVALAADARGAIYITDWALRSYPNHGRGRIWRLTAGKGVEIMPGRPPFATPEADPSGAPLHRVHAAAARQDFEALRVALTSDDPFVRSAAVTALARPGFRDQVVRAVADADPRVRLGVVLALHRGGYEKGEGLARRLLTDSDPLVRRMTLIWIGSSGMTALEPLLDGAILMDPPSPELFEVYLATLQQLSAEFVQNYAAESEPYARQLKRLLRPRFVESFIADESRPARLRAIAVTHLEDVPSQARLLTRLASARNPPVLRREAIRSLRLAPGEEAARALLAIVRNRGNSAELRAEAWLSLAAQPADASQEALKDLDDNAPAVRLEAARYLRSVQLTETSREAVARRATALIGPDAQALHAQLAFAGASPAEERPETPDAWGPILATGGDPAAGRRVFFSAPSACSQCHAIDRRGGDLGSDLTNIGRSKSRRQILDAILRPSAEISPEYQGWFVKTRDGQVHTGRQIDVGNDGKADLYVLSGEFITVTGVTEYGPMPNSLMPDGLETNLTIDDLRNLLAFLEAGA